MQPSTRKWFARGLRLSIVVGLARAAFHTWTVFSQYTAEVERTAYMRQGYGCAARLDDGVLNARISAVGNINVGDLCGTGKAFWVAPHEIADVRAGTMKFDTYSKPFHGFDTLIIGLLAAAATLLAMTIALGVVGAARSVWGPNMASQKRNAAAKTKSGKIALSRRCRVSRIAHTAALGASTTIKKEKSL